VATLKDITTKIGSGATPLGGEKVYLDNRDTHALIRSQCVYDRYLDLNRLSFIDDASAQNLSTVALEENDLLLNITGDGTTFGRCCKVTLEALPACVNQHVSIIRVNPTLADPNYVLSYLTHPIIKDYIESFNAGGSRRAITKGHIERFIIPLPPLVEQRAIGSLLGTLDDKIKLNRRTNETLESLARGIFTDWFVDFGPTRAKVEGRPPYLASDLWSRFPNELVEAGTPKGWDMKPVYQHGEFVNGAAYKDMHFTTDGSGWPVIKIAELKSGVTSQTRFTSTELGPRYRIDTGELLFSWSGNPDTSIDTFIWVGGSAWLNQHIFAVRSNGTASRTHLYLLLKHLRPEFAEIARNKQTTGLGHVTVQDLRRLEMAYPDAPVRAAFESIAAPLVQKIEANLIENRALSQICDLLLPKLMSGEVRVRDDEHLVGGAI